MNFSHPNHGSPLHGQVMMQELAAFMLGKQLGGGMRRDVYQCALRPEWVIKVERLDRSFGNAREWYVWQETHKFGMFADLRQYLCPCVAISGSGSFLLMEKARVCTLADIPKLPKTVPGDFTDLQVENWGQLPNGKYVCIDYDSLLRGDAKPKGAKWWSVNDQRR